MDADERAGRLDQHAGRNPRPSPERRARPARPTRGRARPWAAGVLLAVLASGWLLAHRRGPSPSAALVPSTVSAVTTTTRPRANDRALRARLAGAAACIDLGGVAPAVRCQVDGLAVEVWALGGVAPAAYVRDAGPIGPPVPGGPTCAQGRAEERSWSSAIAPTHVRGRYRCRFEEGRAAMWWTDEGLLLHATRPDADLARLFGWWRARRFECTPAHPC